MGKQMKKQKKIKYKRTKDYKDNLEELGEEGWKLVTIDGNEAIFTLEEIPVYEYQVIQPDMRPRHEIDIQGIIDGMSAEGWQLLSTAQGPRVFDMALIFQREIV